MQLKQRLLWISLVQILIIQSAFNQNPAQWRGEYRNGSYDEGELLKKWPEKGPKLNWAAEGVGSGWGSPSVANNIGNCLGGN